MKRLLKSRDFWAGILVAIFVISLALTWVDVPEYTVVHETVCT
jgi:hypothetical protein